MDPEEIKVGETYNVRMNLQRIDEDGDFWFRVFGGDNAVRFLKPTQVERAVYPLSDMANGTKNAETSTETPEKEALFATLKKLESLPPNFPHPETPPKYDPCRPFKAGDIVEPCQVKGRWLSEGWKNRKGIRYKVTSDEDDDCVMWVQDPDSLYPKCVAAVFFQLVTPVEELKPYFISEGAGIIEIWNGKGEVEKTWYYDAVKAGVEALAAAEAECAMLNGERNTRNDRTRIH